MGILLYLREIFNDFLPVEAFFGLGGFLLLIFSIFTLFAEQVIISYQLVLYIKT